MKKYSHYISKEAVKKIHEETLNVLAHTGVLFECEEVLDIFKQHGFKTEGNIVFFTDKQVEDAIQSAPAQFDLVSSKGNLHIGQGSRITMPACSSIYIEDDGIIRKMTNEDVFNLYKLCCTSDEIGYDFINYFPDDKQFTKEQKIFSHAAIQLKYGTHPGHICPKMYGEDSQTAQQHSKKGIDLIRRFEGVDDDKCVNIMGINSLTPLCFNEVPLATLITYAKEGQPIWVTPCGMPGMTSPPSLLSTMALTNAEVLSALTLTQLINPGTPFIFGNTSAATNLRTIQLSIGAPETALIVYATVAMADYYQLPCRSGGSLSDAKDVDYQAGAESMLVMNATLEAGVDICMHACGIMGSFNVTSFEKFIFDEESIAYNRRLLKGFDISDDHACRELIEKVGVRGSYLKGRTPKIYREEFYFPKVFNKQDPNEWQNEGAMQLKAFAYKKVEERLASYQPPKLTHEQEILLKPYLPEDY